MTQMTLEQRLERLERVNAARLDLDEHRDEHGFVRGSYGLIGPAQDEAARRPAGDPVKVAAAKRELTAAQAALDRFWREVMEPGRLPRGFMPAHAAAGIFLDDEAMAYEPTAFCCPPERQGEHDRLRSDVEAALVAYNRAAGIIRSTDQVIVVTDAPEDLGPIFRDGRWVAG